MVGYKHIIVLYAFFWVIPRRLNFVCRRFGTLCSIFIGRCLYEELNTSPLWGGNCKKHSTIWKTLHQDSFFIQPPAYEDGKDRVFRNVGTQNSEPGNNPEESIQHLEHGESLKSRIHTCILMQYDYTVLKWDEIAPTWLSVQQWFFLVDLKLCKVF